MFWDGVESPFSIDMGEGGGLVKRGPFNSFLTRVCIWWRGVRIGNLLIDIMRNKGNLKTIEIRFWCCGFYGLFLDSNSCRGGGE